MTLLLQIVTVVNSYLLLLPVSNGDPLYFGLMIGDQNDGGAKMGVDCALDRINNINIIPDHTLRIVKESRVRQLDYDIILSSHFKVK